MNAKSQLTSRSTTKINNQQVVNNFYLTVPSVTQQQLPLMTSESLKNMVNQVQKGFGVSMSMGPTMPLFYN